MNILLTLAIGIAFTAFAALVFSVLTMVLAKFWDDFDVSGPDGWRFWEFYSRYLIVAAVFTFVSIPLGSRFLGIAALAVAYKFVFDAGWVQAAVIGTIGGVIACVLFLILVALILIPVGLMVAP